MLPKVHLCCCQPLFFPALAESARLLGVLIRSAPKLVLPYTAPVLRALVGKLRAAGSGATSAPLAAAPKPSSKSSSQGGALGRGCGDAVVLEVDGAWVATLLRDAWLAPTACYCWADMLACCRRGDSWWGLRGPPAGPPACHPGRSFLRTRGLCDPAEDGFEVAVLTTLGELATVAGTQLRADVPEILPLVIDAIQDSTSPAKRLVAVGTLGQVGARLGASGEVRVSRPAPAAPIWMLQLWWRPVAWWVPSWWRWPSP